MNNGKEHSLNRTLTAAVIAVLIVSAGARAQQNTPELTLDEYRIIGRDTRVFTVTGERSSTVFFTPMALTLPEEQRRIRESQGLISNDDRMSRQTVFSVNRGPDIDFDYTGGALKTNDLYAKMGWAGGSGGGTVRFTHWSGEANTPTNLAPTAQDIDATFYQHTFFGDLTLGAGYTRQYDDMLSRSFRPDNRELIRLRGEASLGTELGSRWSARGRARFIGGTYTNLITVNENEEMFLAGGGDIAGEMLGGTITLRAETDYYSIEDASGSSLTAGGNCSWLLGRAVGFTAGALVSTFAMPSEDTEVRVYPTAALDIRMTSRLSVRASYQPRLVTHTFGDIYDMNGMAALTTPLLYEDRSSAAAGEIGIRLTPGLSISAGWSQRIAENAPVFTRTVEPGGGEFYEIVTDAEVTLRTVSVAGSYQSGSRLEIDGEFRSQEASWNLPGDVPYIPDVEGVLIGSYLLGNVWKVVTQAHFHGEHFVEVNSEETEDSFFVIDLGIERSLFRESTTLSLNLKNLTDQDGSWWSGGYRIPGFGFYFGVRTHY
ncbi:hypothetical protein ACFL5H_02220 [Candidatus Latescibacterota bacterium]